MTKAILYRRVSTDEQGLGLAAQLDPLEAEAKRKLGRPLPNWPPVTCWPSPSWTGWSVADRLRQPASTDREAGLDPVRA
jgi:hypothetical protein